MSYLDDNFQKWCSQWQDAQDKGLFQAPKKDPIPSQQTGDQSFFGMNRNAPAENVKDADAKYWSDLYKLSKDYGSTNDVPLDDYLSGELMQETVAEKKAVTPNPVKVNTLGKDQDGASVGVHYDVGDFQGLENLKLKLHGLLDKLNGMEGRGQGAAKLESQITALEKQIDELSNNLGHANDE